MRHRLFHASGLVVMAALTFSANPAAGQTVAAGPYYATPSWDQTLPCTTPANCPRFIVLSNFGGAAVLDRETGLVWEKSPSSSTQTFDFAPFSLCNSKNVGGRTGWRVPTLWELMTLVDPAEAAPSLPPGHPFTNVQSSYWTATPFSVGFGAQSAYVVVFSIGAAGTTGTSQFRPVWCVRAPGGVNPVNPNSP
jgi:hypothetical protein